MLARRKENDDPEAINPKHRRHGLKTTQPLGFVDPTEMLRRIEQTGSTQGSGGVCAWVLYTKPFFITKLAFSMT